MFVQNIENVWYEKYRPEGIDDIVLPESLKNTFREHIKTGIIPHLGLFSKVPGTGKSSLAKVIINELKCDSLWVNASLDKGIDVLRSKIHRFSSSPSISGSKIKIVVMDEFDYFSRDGQAAFRGFIDEFGGNTRFIFTGNVRENVIQPLLDRLEVYDFQTFNPHDIIKPIYERLSFILKAENIRFEKADLVQIIKTNFPGIRKMIGTIAKNISSDDSGRFLKASDNIEIKSLLIDSIKSKDYLKLQKVAYLEIPSAVYSELREEIPNFLPENKWLNGVIILGKYQFQSQQVQDANLNLLACLAELAQLL